jgi:hypothetical protein
MTATSYPSVAYLRKHVGHEIQYFSFAVSEFEEGSEHEVPLHDSALVRARGLLEFFTNRKRDGIKDFYRRGVPKDRLEEPWYEWISTRLAHLEPRRETGEDHDQWLHAEPGGAKGPDRLLHLAEHVFTTIEDRLPDLETPYANTIREVTDAARAYVRSPSDRTWEALCATVVV